MKRPPVIFNKSWHYNYATCTNRLNILQYFKTISNKIAGRPSSTPHTARLYSYFFNNCVSL